MRQCTGITREGLGNDCDVIDMSTTLESALEAGAPRVLGALMKTGPVQVDPEGG